MTSRYTLAKHETLVELCDKKDAEIEHLKKRLYGERTMSPCCNAPMMKFPSTEEWLCHECKARYRLNYKTNQVGALITR